MSSKIEHLPVTKCFEITTGKLNSNAAKEGGQYPFFTCAKELFHIDTFAFDQEALLLAGNNAQGEYDVKHYSGKFNAYQRTYVLTLANSSNSYNYFKYALQAQLERLKSNSKGTNTKYITMEILERTLLPVPTPEEQKRIAAAKRAEEARIAAEQAKLAAELEAYKARCEPASASDDPFASFNTSEEPRMDIVLNIGEAKMKLQATKNGGCMWLGNYNRPEAIPALLIEESYLQNPNVKTQYILNITEGDKTGIASITPNMNFNISTTGSFMLDFENYECSLRRKGGSQIKISCNDGIIVRKRLTDVKNIVNSIREEI